MGSALNLNQPPLPSEGGSDAAGTRRWQETVLQDVRSYLLLPWAESQPKGCVQLRPPHFEAVDSKLEPPGEE